MPATTTSSVLGLFKTVFDKKLAKNDPSFGIFQDRIGLQSANMPGDFWQVGVVLQSSQSTTYAPSQSESVAPALMAAVPASVKQAQVTGYQRISRTQLTYSAAAKAAEKGEKAFEQAYGFVMADMKESATKREELSILYGQLGLGVVSTCVAGVITITTDSWSPGTWAGLTGAVLEAFTTTAATATQHNTDLTITKVDLPNRQITVSGTSAAVVLNDVLYFKTARTTTGWNEGAGLMKILSTTSGTMFNIDFGLDTFQAQQYPVGGQLNFSAIITAAMMAANYGTAEDTVLAISPGNWSVLASDEGALRRFDSSYKKTVSERGVESIKFHCGLGSIEILPHPYMRDSAGAILALDYCVLVGASKLTSGLPGIGDLAVQVQDTAAVELRMFADEAPFITKPSVCVNMTGITL